MVGMLAMAAGILTFGNDPFGWRIASALVGAVSGVIAYQIGLIVTGRKAVGVLTASLLLLDTFYFTYSRMGIVDVFLTVLSMGMLLAFACYLKSPPSHVRGPLLLTGLLTGLSIAAKWSGAYGAFFIGFVVIMVSVVK